jgi:hypothetical protein
MAGGGMNSGIIEQTDEYRYVVKDPVHVHDLQTINSALLGYGSHSVDIPVSRPALRLTDVSGTVVKSILI